MEDKKILTKIREALCEKVESITKDNTFYGLKPSNIEMKTWDYYVLGRTHLKRNYENDAYNYYFYIDVINEDFIDEKIISEIVDAVESVGLKQTADEQPIDYIEKGKTSIICEMVRLTFTRPWKKK